MIASHRASVISSGFSTITCFPARAAATAGSRCAPLGVPIVTIGHPRVGQHLVQAMIGPAAGAGGQPVGGRRDGVEAGDQFGPRTSSIARAWNAEIMPQPMMPKPWAIC